MTETFLFAHVALRGEGRGGVLDNMAILVGVVGVLEVVMARGFLLMYTVRDLFSPYTGQRCGGKESYFTG